MQKRKMPRDPNSLAAKIVAISTGQPTPGQADKPPIADGKNPAAVALGRLGGLKGGKARAEASDGSRDFGPCWSLEEIVGLLK
jgi:hypothetical protein